MDNPPRLSLVAYTYNNARLADGLLAAVRSWSLAPDELIVVDDCSAVPYRLPEGLGRLAERARILRPPANLGPAGAKREGISAARGELILSLDCDIRPHEDWLPHALTLLARPDIGLVGAPAVQDTGDADFTAWVRLMEEHPDQDVSTPFLSAQLWLLRRSTWRAAGGFGGHDQPTHEDLHFSRVLRSLDLGLVSTGSRPARSVRRMHRCDYLRRHVKYLGPAVAARVRSAGLEEACRPLLAKALTRLSACQGCCLAMAAYFEFLHVAVLALDLGRRPECADAARAWNCLAVLGSLIGRRPNLRGLLAGDVARLGHAWTESGGSGPWGGLLAPLVGLDGLEGCLDLLEREGVQRLLASDAALAADFHYLRAGG